MRNILEIANELTSSDRPSVYGRALEDYECTAAMWNAMLHKANPTLPPGETLITPELAAAMMAAMKLSRFAAVAVREVLHGDVTSKHMDSLVDGAGYLRVVQLIRDQRSARDFLDSCEEVPPPAPRIDVTDYSSPCNALTLHDCHNPDCETHGPHVVKKA